MIARSMMYHCFLKPFSLSLFFLALCTALPAQDAPPAAAGLERQLEDLVADENLTGQERLQAQTDLLLESISQGLPVEAEVWDRVEGVLSKWEESADLDAAREAYLSLLSTIASRQAGRDESLSRELSLRTYLQKALALTLSPEDEGRFLFYLADSWFRSQPEDPAAYRRAESLLLQASMILREEQPKDAVYFRLGQLYRTWGLERGPTDGMESDGSFLTRAVENFRAVLNMPGARDLFTTQAERDLEELLQPELILEIDHRYLPQNDMRIRLRTRNLDTVRIDVTGLPPGLETDPHSLAELAAALDASDAQPEQIRFTQSFAIRGRHPHDWREREVRLGETFPAGWYGVLASAEGVRKKDLLLVTPLEVAAFPRKSGSLLVWAVDAETGQPAASASISALDSDGEVLANAAADAEGKVLFGEDAVAGWREIHVAAGLIPGHVRREDIPAAEPPIPWVITNPAGLSPGGSLQWSLLGDEASLEGGVAFHLPDGSSVPAEAQSSGEGWRVGELAIPEGLSRGGPVYAELPGGKHLFAAHIRHTSSSPLVVEFSGEQLDPSLNLYLSTTPVGIQISPTFGSEPELPDFIRLVAREVERKVVGDNKEALTGADGRVIFEAILPFEEIDQGGVYVELPEVSALEGIVPVRVEVLALDSLQPIARGYFGLTSNRHVVQLTSGQRIVRPGEPLEVAFSTNDIHSAAAPRVDGELVISRETWENRYLHRRRGTPLSEREYRDLPDRSLLGAAKTDYRLAEEGFVREEVRRIPIEASRNEGVLTIQLERPGYYNIEFDGRDMDSVGDYPEGPIEVWVVPDSPDLRGFRSDKPRLVLEQSPSGPLEVLVLLDRAGTSVLVDIEYADGSTETIFDQPSEAALFISRERDESSWLSSCRILVAGERKVDLLWEEPDPRPSGEWELEAGELFGLNPGADFEWALRTESPTAEAPILWTFFPSESNSLTAERLRWQEKLQDSSIDFPEAGVAYLTRWLPLFHPFAGAQRPTRPEEVDGPDPVTSPDVFATLFPEAQRFPQPALVVPAFQPVDAGDGDELNAIAGKFPNTAGRWFLSLLSASGHHSLQVESWLVSTELPIRTFLDGLASMRVGDMAFLPLSIENTTREGVLLEVRAAAEGGLSVESPFAEPLLLSPSRTENLGIEALAREAGDSRVEVTVQGEESSSEAFHTIAVSSRPPLADFVFYAASSDTDWVEQSIDLDGWLQGKIIVSSGPGTLLSEIWPVLREEEAGPEPLMAALGDWALHSVKRHHGMDVSGSGEQLTEALSAMLSEHQTPTGGWSWLPESEPDPWLSAFIMWALEIFSGQDTEAFADIRLMGRSYLESILIDDTLEAQSRLFALRALAVPGFHEASLRPSRIQARSFLDFLHRRLELSGVEVAFLLQVAKAYDFNQEVRLLADDLRQRIELGDPSSGGFWAESLYYLALDETQTANRSDYSLLLRALDALGQTGATRSWEQVGGFLNLLAAYYWKGDFNMDGTAEVWVRDDAPFLLSLNPDLQAGSILRHPLDETDFEAGTLPVRIDMTAALSPVLLAGIGFVPSRESSVPMESAEVRYEREYFEETLLKGTRQRVIELDEQLDGIRVGDILRVSVFFENPVPRSYAEFRIPVPAGFSLQGDQVEHIWEISPDGSPGGRGTIEVVGDSEDGLLKRVRMGPLPAGGHQFSLSYKVLWSGHFNWPQFQIVIPRTGEVLGLNTSRVVEVAPLER